MAEFPAPLPTIGSFLLASTDPVRLRGWYERAFGVTADADGNDDFAWAPGSVASALPHSGIRDFIYCPRLVPKYPGRVYPIPSGGL